jgi:TusA-related sulfurtransferase
MTTSQPIRASVLLDNRRTPCAVGLIRAARTMRDLPTGTVLEIWSRDRFAPMEIPIWAERDGHRVVVRGQAGRWPKRHYVFEVHKDGGTTP